MAGEARKDPQGAGAKFRSYRTSVRIEESATDEHAAGATAGSGQQGAL